MELFIAYAVVALIAAASAYAQAEAQRRQQEYEAEIARNNALAKDQQAAIIRQQTEAKRVQADDEKNKLSREYRRAAGTNLSLLSAQNVAVSEGSAFAGLEGSMNRYADDMGEMEYRKEVNTWAGMRESQVTEWEADVLRSNASFLDATAGSVGQSLLTGLGAGVSSFAGSYAAGSGSTPTQPTSGTFKSGTFSSGSVGGPGGNMSMLRPQSQSMVSSFEFNKQSRIQ